MAFLYAPVWDDRSARRHLEWSYSSHETDFSDGVAAGLDFQAGDTLGSVSGPELLDFEVVRVESFGRVTMVLVSDGALVAPGQPLLEYEPRQVTTAEFLVERERADAAESALRPFREAAARARDPLDLGWYLIRIGVTVLAFVVTGYIVAAMGTQAVRIPYDQPGVPGKLGYQFAAVLLLIVGWAIGAGVETAWQDERQKEPWERNGLLWGLFTAIYPRLLGGILVFFAIVGIEIGFEALGVGLGSWTR